MYPPKVTDSLDESISNLFASLQRAGDQWTGQMGVADKGDGVTHYAFYLRDSIPEKAKKDLMAYARGYMKRSGWRVAGVRLVKRYLEVSVSNI
jgi:hypothetical protein